MDNQPLHQHHPASSHGHPQHVSVAGTQHQAHQPPPLPAPFHTESYKQMQKDFAASANALTSLYKGARTAYEEGQSSMVTAIRQQSLLSVRRTAQGEEVVALSVLLRKLDELESGIQAKLQHIQSGRGGGGHGGQQEHGHPAPQPQPSPVTLAPSASALPSAMFLPPTEAEQQRHRREANEQSAMEDTTQGDSDVPGSTAPGVTATATTTLATRNSTHDNVAAHEEDCYESNAPVGSKRRSVRNHNNVMEARTFVENATGGSRKGGQMEPQEGGHFVGLDAESEYGRHHRTGTMAGVRVGGGGSSPGTSASTSDTTAPQQPQRRQLQFNFRPMQHSAAGLRRSNGSSNNQPPVVRGFMALPSQRARYQ